MTTPNAELAYRVLDYIEAHPEQHDQSDFIAHTGMAAVVSAETATCGTTACFAGWTVLLSGHELVLGRWWPVVDLGLGATVDVDDMAAQLLGLGDDGTYGPAGELFYRAFSLADVRVAVGRLFGPRPDAEVQP